MIAKHSKGRLQSAYSDRGKRNTMVYRDFSRWSLRGCKRAVNGCGRGFRVGDQRVDQHGRRRRRHRRCIGCGDNTGLGCYPRTRPQTRSGDRINKSKDRHFLVRPGSHFPAPAVRVPPARRARASQGRPPFRRSPAGLVLDRPSTVLRLQEAVTITGMVLFELFVSCGSDRQPSGPRPAASGQAGLGRAASQSGPAPQGRSPRGRARSSPLRRGAAQRRDNSTLSTPDGEQCCGLLGLLLHPPIAGVVPQALVRQGRGSRTRGHCCRHHCLEVRSGPRRSGSSHHACRQAGRRRSSGAARMISRSTAATS